MGKFEFPEKIKISENASDLIIKCLNMEPSKRIKAEQILKHPFLTGPEFIPNQLPVEFITQQPSDLYILNCINNYKRPGWDPLDVN